MENSSISSKFIDRLELFMQKEGLNNNQITVKAHLSNGLIGKALKNRTAMNSDSIENILYAFPHLNADWLMTGRGEMLLSEKEVHSNSYYEEKIEELQKEIAALNRENGRLEGKLDILTASSTKAI